jgi:hypothetical protein
MIKVGLPLAPLLEAAALQIIFNGMAFPVATI